MAKSKRKTRGAEAGQTGGHKAGGHKAGGHKAGGHKAGGRKTIQWGGAADKQTGRLNMVLLALVAAALAAGAIYWWQTARSAAGFDALVAEGQPALAAVESQTDTGSDHLTPGAAYNYGVPFPTSGPHDPDPTDPGFYSAPQPPTKLVHALEHGHVVIYYDQPGETALGYLKDWAALFGGHWDGVVVAPGAALGRAVVLTAWRKTLRLDNFEPTTVAAFIDAYRGRGPENPVR